MNETTETPDIKFVWCSYDVFTMFYADDDFDSIFPADPLKLDPHYRLVKAPVSATKMEDGVLKIEVSGGTWGEKKWPAKIWLQFGDSCWDNLRDASKRMMERCLEQAQWGLKIVYELLDELDKAGGDFQQPVHGAPGDLADFFLLVESSMGLRFGYAQQNMLKVLQQHRRLLLQEKGAE